jgi:anti-sigma regulatory factor (Ser/Thr protein kinase)
VHLHRIELPVSNGSPRRARSELSQLVEGERLFLALLLVSELVTNAVIHARTPLAVDFELDRDLLRVDVRDGNPDLVRLGRPEDLASGGRGLSLVEQTADNWGVDRDGVGKSVWFELGGFRQVEEHH